MKRFPCPCCRFITLETKGWFEICPVCGWEFSGQDDQNADEYAGGPNRVTPTEARENFAKLGASEERRQSHVRAPRPCEQLGE
uniref:CPCC family cysteine-rich protein n=1 Tax=Streptomyces sp. HSW2009 TaxID=3142890 RepID=UPI0032ECF7E1